MINLNKKDPVADAVKDILQQEALKGNQDKIDANHNNKIDAEDFKILRGKKKVSEELKGNQDKIDANHNGKIDGQDFKILRAKKKVSEESGRTEDCLDGKPKAKKGDDVGPGADGKSSKVKLKSEQITLKGLKEKLEEPILDELINEVLSKDASAGSWIHDFVHSDNPKFAGKSKAKRKEMALAAYYSKKNEEVELEEASDTAVKNKEGKVVSWAHEGDWKKTDTKKNPEGKIHNITGQAFQKTKKLSKEEVELEEGLGDKLKAAGKKALEKLGHGSDEDMRKDLQKKAGLPQTGKKPTSEEVEQIDELKKSTLGSYVKGAARDMSASRKIATDFEHRAERAKKPSMKGAASRLSDKFNAIARKRNAGIGKAVERLTKEETVEEGWDDMVKSAKDAVKSGPKPSGGSGVKQGSRYGGGKQKDKPEHDDDKVKNEAKRPDTDTVPFVTDEAKPMTHAKYLAKKSLKRMRTEMLGKISN